jgi:hypothetical protein
MSEFSLYDFRRIDTPLSIEERKQVSALSSHIEVSSRRAVVSYSYGSFKHNEEKVVELHFDALLHQTNWGQKKLVFKFPKDSIDYKQLGQYDIDAGDVTGYGTEIRSWKSGNYVLVNIEYCDDDFEGWVEENDQAMDTLLELRTDMMNGDFSCLYAFWLKILSLRKHEEDDESADELPEIPLGLAKPSAALRAFVDFYEIDEKIVNAAGTFVSTSTKAEPNYQSLLDEMDNDSKNKWLMRIINGETLLDIKLKKHLFDPKSNATKTLIKFEDILNKALGVG